MDPFHTFDGLAQYDVELFVVHPAGCIDTALGIIHAPPILYIPNSFTPNNDGVNDYFSVLGDQLLRFELTIFNRWGDLYSTVLISLRPGMEVTTAGNTTLQMESISTRSK
jgi:gliding motility-associated-like protein